MFELSIAAVPEKVQLLIPSGLPAAAHLPLICKGRLFVHCVRQIHSICAARLFLPTVVDQILYREKDPALQTRIKKSDG